MGLTTREKQKLVEVVSLLRKCESILFITGAGISADSGLPTYRGIGGLYEDKVTEDGLPIEMALAGDMLKRRPEVTWKYLAQIEKNCRGAKFNRAHEVIAEMERNFRRVWLLTQNIDGFHRAAGSRNVIDIHGDFHRLLCPGCGWQTTTEDYSQLRIPPICPECSHIVRPEVVFFGEMLAPDKLQTLYQELGEKFDIYFSIGTTSVFPYIQSPIVEAKSLKRPTIEINPGQTAVSDLVDIKISVGAAEALELLWRLYQEEKV